MGFEADRRSIRLSVTFAGSRPNCSLTADAVLAQVRLQQRCEALSRVLSHRKQPASAGLRRVEGIHIIKSALQLS